MTYSRSLMKKIRERSEMDFYLCVFLCVMLLGFVGVYEDIRHIRMLVRVQTELINESNDKINHLEDILDNKDIHNHNECILRDKETSHFMNEFRKNRK
jgi:hypothetical protein